MRNNSTIKSIKKYKLYYLLIIPGMLYYIIFRYAPMYGIIIAFKDVKPFESIPSMITSQWVGLKHFKNFFESYYFIIVMRNTLLIGLYRIVFGFPVPIIFALLLNEIKNTKFKRITQTIAYMPHFVSMVVLASLVATLTTTQGGLINEVIKMFGGKAINFMGNSRYFRGVLIISDIWKTAGWGTIIYLAAISGINPELYEAAIVDGCNRFKQVFYITLPNIAGVVSIMLIMATTKFINAGFEQILLMYSEPVYDVADIIDTFVYRQGLQMLNYSYSAAVGLFKSVIAAILIILTNTIVRKLGQEGIW